jgi:perosamine synthetase
MISDFLCPGNKSVMEAMQIINNNSQGVCFVTDTNDSLIGVITDGDIRRVILSGAKLQTPISEILNKNYVFGKKNDNTNSLLKKLNKKIRIIPIIDENNKVIDYIEYSHSSHFPAAMPTLNGNEFKYLTDAFFSSWISSKGRYIDLFEGAFSNFSDCAYGVSVSNGTTALHLSMIALGIGRGDEVIIPDLTFAATINSVIHANATPVIVDIESDSWCIDPQEIEKAITKNTKAIIPVHLYGQPCDMDAIMKIARKYNLLVIEDCAEAHGATFNNKKVGSFGDIGCFSFYGNKVITTGEGGMCTTNDLKLSAKMKLLRDHGMSKDRKYWHDVVGYNYRMTNLQAAIGLAQFERIKDILKNRREYENGYKKILKKNLVFQKDFENRKRITWLVSLLVDESTSRDQFINKLTDKGVDARPFFYPLSSMDIYKKYCNSNTVQSNSISKRGLSLPTYESLKSIKELILLLKDFK